ncbi:MAG: insulinase family protein, partial [Polaromonas sp.]|nr:insulinase family protein [Polaromonas sp.]
MKHPRQSLLTHPVPLTPSFLRFSRAPAALLALCLGAAAFAQAPGLKPEVEQFTLANGLTVIVKPDHRAPTAVHMLWVRVGAMDE